MFGEWGDYPGCPGTRWCGAGRGPCRCPVVRCPGSGTSRSLASSGCLRRGTAPTRDGGSCLVGLSRLTSQLEKN